MPTRYPLSWPTGWKRTHLGRRSDRTPFSTSATRWVDQGEGKGYTARDRYQLTVAASLKRLYEELDRLGAANVTLSSNLALRADGQPKSGQVNPADPGIAVYFTLRDKPVVLACDRFVRAEVNIGALAKHIEAMRTMERYGVGSVEQAFAGYAALPASPESEWWHVLEVPRDSPRDVVRAAFVRLAAIHHPDKPTGSERAMQRLNEAYLASKRVGA
jgi:hypothetical protein